MTVMTLTSRPVLEPSEFCRKYSRYKSDMWGYRGHWNRLIAKVLEISVKTVEGWGEDFKECPDRYKRQLDAMNALMEADRALKRLGLDTDNLEPDK